MDLELLAENAHGTRPGPTDKSRDFSLHAKDSAPRRVLVVDDEPLVRWCVCQTLMDGGYEVVEAADGASAIRSLVESPRPIDAVFLDLCLPDSSDLQILSNIRRLSPTTAVILMTAFGTPEMAAEARRIGAFSVVAKPIEMSEVTPLVGRALSRRPS